MSVFAASDLVCRFPSVETRGPLETARLGGALSNAVSGGLLILLYGPLGAGKTLLSVSIGEALGAGRMKSPSFAVESIHKLPGKNFFLVHADLYRLEDALSGSPETMQLEEYLDDGALVLVEWAERWKNPPRRKGWDVRISVAGDAKRSIDFAVHGEETVAAFAAAFSEVLEPCR